MKYDGALGEGGGGFAEVLACSRCTRADVYRPAGANGDYYPQPHRASELFNGIIVNWRTRSVARMQIAPPTNISSDRNAS